MTGKGTLGSVFDFLTVILIFLFTLLLAYLATKFIASYQKNRGFRKGQIKGNIEVIETYPVAQGKYIQILRIGKKYISISVCKDEINLLTELNEEDLEIPSEEDENKAKNSSFKDILAKVKAGKSKESK
ncbi:MAG: flagellar biosynthetic protein FliO [Lachnospiraceae bacterium]|nr:flagellar biosynthetic protein FliO [Candidatus Merdinaster equi]